MLPFHALPLGFWLMNPGFNTCDDPLQIVVTFLAILSQIVGTDAYAHLSVP
jgi:hypothetical protein